jgi:hypothetical protein
MAVGRGASAAIVGAIALGSAVGALLAAGAPRVDADKAARAGDEARAALEAARDSALRTFTSETAPAASIPQLGAALRNKVDAFTMDDLFASESWWAAYRALAVSLVGPAGPLVTRNAPPGGLGGADLIAQTATKPGAAGFALLGDRVFLEAAHPVDAPALPGDARWTLLFGRPVDPELLGGWAKAAQAVLLVSDSRRAILSTGTGGAASAAPQDLVGREGAGRVVDGAGAWVATSLALGTGVWVWSVRALPAEGGPSRSQALGAVAGLLGVVALGLEVSRRRRSRAGDPAAAALVPVSDPGGAAAPAAAPGPAPPASEPPAAAPPRSTAASVHTMIAGGEPQVFGRYTVFHRLGEGGMCELFIAGLAGPEGFQRTLVLKRLKPEIARNRAAVDQFIDEAKLGSTLVHSNIVPVFDFGKVGDGYFIAQEYVVGRNVGQLVERHLERLGEPLEPATVYYIAHEALHALAYAHDRTNDNGEPLHLIHRDVSPGNILVSARGEVKLIDFGIAKAEGRVSHTDMGNVKGNAAYMAPEQARGLVVDARADLFSLGLVMYHALTGQPLYRGSTLAEIFYAAATGPTAEQRADLQRLPPVAAQVLSRALAPDPADRYSNADEFAADLLHHVAPGARATVATLLNALFGPELRPLSGGAGSGGGLGTSGLRRKAG